MKLALNLIAGALCFRIATQGVRVMYLRGLFAACAAVVLCATVVDTAEAYPIVARAGVTTVTGTFRPLDLDLVVVEGTSGFAYSAESIDTGYGTLDLMLTGTYTGVGYTASGNAGDWRLRLNTLPFLGDLVGNTVTVEVPSWGLPFSVGRLDYLGGGTFTGLPPEDTPLFGDRFDLFAVATGAFMRVTCSEDVSTCGAFTAELLQTLTHLGPYAGSLDTSRVNEDCLTDPNAPSPCGTVPALGFRVSGANVPEPASLALVGLGLAGLALARRRKRQS